MAPTLQSELLMAADDAGKARGDGSIRSIVFAAVVCLPLGMGIAYLNSMPVPPELKALVSMLGGAVALYLKMRTTGWWPPGTSQKPSPPEVVVRQPGNVNRKSA